MQIPARMCRLLALGFFLVFVSACGSGSSPTSPGSGVPTSGRADAPAADLTIAGPELVPTGSSVKYDVTAMLTSGVTFYHVTPIWDTDNAAVATMSGNGTLTGHRQGTATITATYRGKSSTASVRVSDFAAKVSSGSPNLAISFRPDPVPGSLAPCMGATPSWSFTEVYNETQGVGFTVRAEVINLYGEDGLRFYTITFVEDYYFSPHSEFVEDTCTDLGTSPSGFFEDIVHGVDDRGNELAFRGRLRLLPVAGVSSPSSRISLVPTAEAVVHRALRRVR
jgi:hypothetical protein